MTAKSYEAPLQTIVDRSGQKRPWFMGGWASIEETGVVWTTVHLESHLASSGFRGGMVVAFLDVEGRAIYTTPLVQCEVDGQEIPSWIGGMPSRDTSTSFHVGPQVCAETDRIGIALFHAPVEHTGAHIAKAQPTMTQLVEWIMLVSGCMSPAEVTVSLSGHLGAGSPPTLEEAA